jgi:hypothetical protein
MNKLKFEKCSNSKIVQFCKGLDFVKDQILKLFNFEICSNLKTHSNLENSLKIFLRCVIP